MGLYSGFATFGRITTIISSSLVFLVSLVVLGVSFYEIFKKKIFTERKTAKVLSYDNNSRALVKIQNCKSDTIIDNLLPGNFCTEEDKECIVYTPKDRCDIAAIYSDDTMTGAGYMGIFIALIIGTLTALNLYFVLKSKDYAAFTGVFDGVNMIFGR